MLQTDAARAIGDILRGSDADVRVPALCDVEVVAALRRAVVRGLISAERADLAVQHYLQLPLTRHGHRALLTRILELRANFSAYDACYVALAEQVAAGLLTADERLSRAILEHTTIPLLR